MGGGGDQKIFYFLYYGRELLGQPTPRFGVSDSYTDHEDKSRYQGCASRSKHGEQGMGQQPEEPFSWLGSRGRKKQ